MPAIYAHRRFGQAVFARLSPALQGALAPQRALFDIGLHGPDILFYYRPISPNPVSQLGHHMHTLSGRDCFTQLFVLAEKHDDAAHRAYLCGFLCHYALDSACHGYINRAARSSGFSHGQVESELDRYFLLADGLDPMRAKTTGHLRPSAENARVIADFFPTLSPAQLLECLRSMVLIEDLWIASNPAKRALVLGAVRLAGQYEYAAGLMRPYRAPAACVGLLPPALAGYEQAIPRAAEWLDALPRLLTEGPPPAFDLPFDPQS